MTKKELVKLILKSILKLVINVAIKYLFNKYL